MPTQAIGRPTGVSSKKPISGIPASITRAATVRMVLVPITVIELPRIEA